VDHKDHKELLELLVLKDSLVALVLLDQQGHQVLMQIVFVHQLILVVVATLKKVKKWHL
jgi:hypothetical protein